MAVSYVYSIDGNIAGMFSLLNDKISIEDKAYSKRFFKRKITSLFPEGKRYTTYPAVKLGRLGINKKFQGQGHGTDIVNFLKEFFIDNNKTGCRFITVDAYNNEKTLKFYQNNGFQFLCDEKKKEDKTKLMFFDLKEIVE